jgi:CheY-like chemotaxis protein
MLQFLRVSISKHAELKVNLTSRWAVLANAAQLRQLVMNLIANASEALGERVGQIAVTTTEISLGPGESPAPLPPGDYLQLEIRDTGIGMTEEVQRKIFDPFFTTKFTGRGLGLAAVQGIVRSHGGAIGFVSALGEGTRFWVLLPRSSLLKPDSPKIEISGPMTSGIRSSAGTILLVEDEDELRQAVAKMLRKEGFMVMEASNGAAAVDLFQANEPDVGVVLLDMTLPGIDGREVLSRLQAIRPNVKVVFTSAYSQAQVVDSLESHESVRFIRKPYQFSELVGLLHTTLSA